MRETIGVTAQSGQVIVVDIGLPTDGNPLGAFLAHLWEWTGDFLYDLPDLMRSCGLEVIVFEEFGPENHVRALVGRKV